MLRRWLDVSVLAAAAALWIVPWEELPSRSAVSASGQIQSSETAPSGAEDTAHSAAIEVMQRFECGRCHLEVGEAVALDKSCSGCHRAIVGGSYDAPAETLADWQAHVRSFLDVPRMRVPGRPLRRSYIREFLAQPHDVRPALRETMPQLPLTADDIERLADWLAGPDEEGGSAAGDAARGARVFQEKSCGTCHATGDVPLGPPSPLSVALEPEELARGVRLAPDLAHAARRLTVNTLRRWIAAPRQLDAASAMPDIPLALQEVEDLVSFVRSLVPAEIDQEKAALRALRTTAELATIPRLTVLDRPVTFDEVDERVLHKVCWHCHSDPDFARGDGGPGNSGGFGFPPRGVHFGSWEGILSGYLNEDGERRSLLTWDEAAPPRLLAALLARRVEEAGGRIEGMRGMPLGLPALAPAEVQLVETWLAQGARY